MLTWLLNIFEYWMWICLVIMHTCYTYIHIVHSFSHSRPSEEKPVDCSFNVAKDTSFYEATKENVSSYSFFKIVLAIFSLIKIKSNLIICVFTYTYIESCFKSTSVWCRSSKPFPVLLKWFPIWRRYRMTTPSNN